ncbi:MAG: L,D-transpeptidase [Chloroflexi bacterium]|jgi:hypothetical protein|nr:L,D-transpeptidase [Chloroflexota bacterium]
MKKILLVSTLAILISISTGGVYAQNTAGLTGNAYFELPLCLPGMPDDGTCLMLGPAQVVVVLKASGFSYPPRGLPAATPPSEMGIMPVFIAQINLPEDQPAPIYESYFNAVAGTNPVSYIATGRMRYISYNERRDDNKGNVYVQLTSGGWTRASPAAYPKFQGLEFYENPKNDFGWVIEESESYIAPSFNAKTTGITYTKYSQIQVYDTVEAEGYLWYQIAPGEWVSSHKARVVNLRPDPPEGVAANRWIELDLFQKTIMAYEDGQLLFATLTTTGIEPFYTKPGVFTIYEKKALADMYGSFEADRSDYYYFQDVPWQMYYDEARAIHTAYWHTFFGHEGSHGCVNLSPGDALWMFLWADEGDYVWVHDPSGRTPTDPSLYGPGAP